MLIPISHEYTEKQLAPNIPVLFLSTVIFNLKSIYMPV